MKRFWIALVALVTPIVHAAPSGTFPAKDWGQLLQRYVDREGRVDYAALKASTEDRRRLDQLVKYIAEISPAKAPASFPSDEAKVYYLNAYNVLVWKSVVDRIGRVPPFTNVDADKEAFFYRTKFSVGGEALSLSELEGKVIRPRFADPRVHMALNCASGGCPVLPREPFAADKLDLQLVREARRFCNEARNVAPSSDGTSVKLSRIFDWYKDDFGGAPDKVLAWINRYRTAPILPGAKIDYLEYDWTLNDRQLLRR